MSGIIVLIIIIIAVFSYDKYLIGKKKEISDKLKKEFALKDTDTFDSMVDKCQDAVNNLLIEDFN